ncbi:MAG: PPOX class F420-dependent oxidoreductase [Thermoproteota archaeon]|nr:PPOX class F420-dependent oxidoreductase [Thermoproteota archaeon]
MKEMSKEEIQTSLVSGTLTGKISTVRKDGRPHVVPIWFILDKNDSNIKVVFTTGQDSLKAKQKLRDPRVSLCVDDQTPSFSFVLIDGIADINKEPDLREILKWATKIAGRYMGQDNAEAYGKRNAVKGEFLVRIRPTKIIAQKDMVGQ